MKSMLPYRLLACVALICGLFFTACDNDAPNAPSGNETVSGVVVDGQGYIVPNAIVKALGSSNALISADTTDEEGAFLLSALPSEFNGLTLQVSHEDFVTFSSALAAAIGSAGGQGGVRLNMVNDDSACAGLSLTITDDSTGAAISGAEVRIRRGDRLKTKTLTDDNGRVLFAALTAGSYSLRIAREGYKVLETEIEIDGCDSVVAAYELVAKTNTENPSGDSCCNSTIKVIARDSATGAIISGAEVKVRRSGMEPRVKTTTDDGATFNELCSGSYDLRIAREGYRVLEFSASVSCNGTENVERTMVPIAERNDSCCDGTIIVVPRDSTSGEFLSGATVKLWKNGSVVAAKTSEGGSVTFGDLCEGRYEISVLKAGYKGRESAIELGCNGRVERTMKLLAESNGNGDSCCGGAIKVIVRDAATGAAVANATVKLWKGGTAVRTVKTNGDGYVRMEELCKADYVIEVTREGYGAIEFAKGIGCNESVVVEKTMSKTGGPDPDSCCTASLKLRVKDATVAEAGWLSGATVVISDGNTVVAEGTTGAEGWYLYEGLCKGTYTVTISKSGFESQTVSFTFNECKRLQETIRL